MSNNNNLAQKSNFTAGSDKLAFGELFLTSVNIPGINLSHPDVGGRTGTKLNLAGDTLTFNSLSFEVLVDEDFNVFHEFTGKVFDNINPETGSFASVEFDFWVDVNNSKGNKLFKMEFYNCRVESIGDIQLEVQSDETEFTLPVEVKFDYYKIFKSTDSIPALRV